MKVFHGIRPQLIEALRTDYTLSRDVASHLAMQAILLTDQDRVLVSGKLRPTSVELLGTTAVFYGSQD